MATTPQTPPPRPSLLEDEVELRRTLIEALHAAARDARDAATGSDAGSARSVHDYRKALRRARAVLSLVGGALPRGERRAVRKALQEARRALGTARDHAVAPETFGVVALDEADRATARAVIDAGAPTMLTTAQIRLALAEGAARAAAQVEALEAALPPELEWATVIDGFRRIYRDARRAYREAKHSRRAFHAWRRRSKELTYQLEWLAHHAGPVVDELYRTFAGVTDTQGPAVDLIMVRDLIREQGQGVEGCDRLLDTLAEHLTTLAEDSRAAGRELYAAKPDRMARRLTKAIRRDLAPRPTP
jgi:CHAD domain-containing protein